MKYYPIEESEDYQRAENILEWGWIFIKMAVIAVISSFILMIAGHYKATFLSLIFGWVCLAITDILRYKARKIMKEFDKRNKR